MSKAKKAESAPFEVSRGDLRAATVGAKIELQSEIVEFKGLKYELRQPSLRERKQLRQKIFNEDGTVDVFEAMIWLTIWQTYIPGTNERVFDEVDYEMFLNNPSGSFVDDFGTKIVMMSNLDLDNIRKN
jgi:hypothetical protein